MGGRQAAIAALESDRRQEFLSYLVYQLSQYGARAHYPVSWDQPAESVTALVSVNELIIVLSKQLVASQRGERAYPDDAMVTVLYEIAEKGGCLYDLRFALYRALNDAHLGSDP